MALRVLRASQQNEPLGTVDWRSTTHPVCSPLLSHRLQSNVACALQECFPNCPILPTLKHRCPAAYVSCHTWSMSSVGGVHGSHRRHRSTVLIWQTGIHARGHM